MARLTRDWRALEPEQRLAGAAALALFVTMLLPWYQQNAVLTATRAGNLQSRNLNAFQVFSFVEAAVLLVALAVCYLLYARAEGYDFHLPGSDGTIVFAAGMWAAALLVLRLFDKPGISGRGVAGNVGVQWGIFFALAAAGALIAAGSRMRSAATRHPPPAPEHELDTTAPRAARARAGSARAAEQRSAPVAAEPRSAPVPAEARPASARPRYPPAPAEQMSFEDPPHGK